MTLAAVFQDLVEQCRTLHDALLGLRLTVVEDKPLTGAVVLVVASWSPVCHFTFCGRGIWLCSRAPRPSACCAAMAIG